MNDEQLNINLFRDIKDIFDSRKTDIKQLKTEIQKYYKKTNKKQSVLGIDLLGYSQYEDFEQILIPYLLRELYQRALEYVRKFEPYIFEDFIDLLKDRENYIDTGDGGFVVFDNPLQSLVFTVFLEAAIREYNSVNTHEKIRKILGAIKVRYSITYDNLLQVQELKNYYGSAIIHAGRIMSRDKLDRCLCDDNTYQWFLENVNGFESIRNLTLTELKKMIKIKKKIFHHDSSYLFPNFLIDNPPRIHIASVSKIGEITAKKNTLSVHNLYMQVIVQKLDDPAMTGNDYYTVSIGNLNSAGLDEKSH